MIKPKDPSKCMSLSKSRLGDVALAALEFYHRSQGVRSS